MSPSAAEVRQMAKAAIPPVLSTILMVSCVFLFLLFYSLFLPERLVKPVMGTSGFIAAALGLIGLRWHRERSLTETLSGRGAIVASLLLFLVLCALLVAGFCNRVVVTALPGSEIHVDGKYFRKVLPGGPPGLRTEPLTLTWERHTIEIRNHPMAPDSVEVFHERFPWGWMRLWMTGSEHDARCHSRLHVSPPVWQFDFGDAPPDSRLLAVNRGLRAESESLAAGIFGSRLKRLPWSAKDREKAEAESDCLTLKWVVTGPRWSDAASPDERLRIEIRHRGSNLGRLSVPPDQTGPGKPDAQVLAALWAASRGPALRVLRDRIHDEELLQAVSRSFLADPPDFATWLAESGDAVSRTGEFQRGIANLVRPDRPPASAPNNRPRPAETGTAAPEPSASTAAPSQLDAIRNLARETAQQLKAQNLEPAIDTIFESLSWARDRVQDPGLKAGLAKIREDLKPPQDTGRRVIVVHYSNDGQQDAAQRIAGALRTHFGVADTAHEHNSPVEVAVESVDSGDFVPFRTELRFFAPALVSEAADLRDRLAGDAAVRDAATLYVLPGWHQRDHARDHGCSTDQLIEIWLSPGA